MTHACDDEDSKIHTVRSTVTEREAREGFSRDLAGEVERAQPSSTFELKKKNHCPLLACYDDRKDKFDQYSLNTTVRKFIFRWHIERKERPPSKLDMPRWIVLYKSCKAEPWNL